MVALPRDDDVGTYVESTVNPCLALAIAIEYRRYNPANRAAAEHGLRLLSSPLFKPANLRAGGHRRSDLGRERCGILALDGENRVGEMRLNDWRLRGSAAVNTGLQREWGQKKIVKGSEDGLGECTRVLVVVLVIRVKCDAAGKSDILQRPAVA